MSNVISLSEKSKDARHWSVLDALQKALDDVKSGAANPDMVFVAFREQHGDNADYGYVTAGGTNIELCGLLSIHLAKISA